MAGRIMIETERLILREFTEDDAEVNLRLGIDPHVLRWTRQPLDGLEHSLQVIRDFPMADYRKHGFGRWVVVLKSTGAMIGWSGLKFLEDTREVDIGYRFLSEHWGKGYATESSRPCLEYGFKRLGLDYIIAFALADNAASIRVLTKLGLTKTGMVQHFDLPHSRFELKRTTWEESVTSQPLPSSGSP
jgi:RimJ/RimL family protein N-acetyltransferase